ncbi:E3 ubiquitin-protein ligase FANCL [Smittium mucronatum]|uniref:E3 ubiquitin-protein ligase FANCL n=1 Tax=Smittium mucronatum TaxID=133383 RepID=A0A1R0GMQ2_9FUNG|nr:E3 ubiquitin-protein ligase FANCL [Smittium mucronatum]OLY78156.1 E3 ubiquitin-protein ligase FANCL [Smittium mucronatum]
MNSEIFEKFPYLLKISDWSFNGYLKANDTNSPLNQINSDVLDTTSLLYSLLIKELDVLGWSDVSDFKPAPFSLTLSYHDEERVAIFDLSVELTDLDVLLKCLVLPTFQSPVSELSPGWLIDYTKNLHKAFQEYRDVWSVLSNIDNNCLVVYPTKSPNSSIISSHPLIFERRIAVLELVSLSFSISPKTPKACPHIISVNGPSHKTQKIKQSISSNKPKWDPNISFLKNLKVLLDHPIPKNIESSASLSQSNNSSNPLQGSKIFCGICFGYTLESGQEPDIVCEYQYCGQSFHSQCLATEISVTI